MSEAAGPLPTPGELLRAYGQRAKKSFGQNFLTHPAILERIVALAELGNNPGGRAALEIGPGPGGLTTTLLAAGADVVAVEADREVAAFLEQTLAPGRSLRIVTADALRLDLPALAADPERVVIANLPYHVATEILFRFVDSPARPRRMVLMFQREVADRIVAPGASRELGVLSIAVQLRYRVRIAQTLPPGAFTPPPKVRSAVVVFERHDPPLVDEALAQATVTVARAAFGQRRKQLRNSLASLCDDVAGWCELAGVSPQARPEELMLDAFVRLARTRPVSELPA